MNDQMEHYINDDKSALIEKYSSMIPVNIMNRSKDSSNYTVLLGIERLDLPKLTSGDAVVWWYCIQLKTCKTCVFLSEKQKEFPYQMCNNPKISIRLFEIISRSMSTCDEWHAGFSEERIESERSMGYSENLYVLAALIKMGLRDMPKNISIPAIGTVKMLQFSIELAAAADIHNAIIHEYIQLCVLKRSGHDIDDEYFSIVSKRELPLIQGDKFNTNLLL